MSEKKEIPVYEKIVQDVQRRIHTGEWKEGTKLPGERELCSLYNVARGTLKAALLELQTQGYVKQVQGSGTYVEKRESKSGELERQADDLVNFLFSKGMDEAEILKLYIDNLQKK